ncbi:MAG: multiple antibiotic resistance protein [Bacteriovoracaceae bacterium]|jgi:multiple antibiotic resistance protein
MPVFVKYTSGYNLERTKKLAQKGTLAAMIAMFIFALSGQMIFKFFNISLDSLRVVGGILFFINGFDMLQAKPVRTKDENEAIEDDEDVGVTPLGIPLLCGPGTITAVILMNQGAPSLQMKGVLYFAIISTSIVVFLMLFGSKWILNKLGEAGTKVLFRIMGLIVMVIAVEYFFTGLRNLLRIT